jgi:class 3 adenylate cyclase
MQDLAQWLEELGMSEYAQRFAENRIDLSVLPDLTDQDLEKLGVVLGDRRKMLRAIANLDKAQPAVASAPAASAQPIAVTTAVPTGERRHVTVMFCDLMDSTGIAARLDAEEWRDLVGAYLDAASSAVTDMGGKVAKKLGDGLMALFGYPVAQENDAERAVRAALAIQRSLTELNRKNEGTGKPALAARIAIDLGPVVVDATGEIFGDVPNVAARAQALAEAGSVVVTARVQRQMAGLFVVEERGSHELKGVPEPVMLYRIVRASGAGRRAGQRHLTPLVGREEEIATDAALGAWTLTSRRCTSTCVPGTRRDGRRSASPSCAGNRPPRRARPGRPTCGNTFESTRRGIGLGERPGSLHRTSALTRPSRETSEAVSLLIEWRMCRPRAPRPAQLGVRTQLAHS